MDKKKSLIYAAALVAPAIILFFVLFFAVKPGADYIVAYEVLSVEVSYFICGIVWHTLKKDWSVKIIASRVWFLVAIAGTVSVIIGQTWEEMGVYVPLTLLGLVNWLGFRFVVGDDSNFIPSIKADRVEALAQKMLFKVDEHGREIESEPLCIVEGTPVTPARAREKGYLDVAEKGYEYIRSIV